MSGCYPGETLSVCVHGTPVKLICAQCSNEHRLNLMESQIKALTDMYKELSLHVVSHEDHKIKQVDENRKISRRVDEIENGLIKRIRILGEALHELSEENHKLRKLEHECKVCEGTGKIWI